MVVVAKMMSSTITTLPGTRTESSSSFLVSTWTLWLSSMRALTRCSFFGLAAEHAPALHGEHGLAGLVDRLPAVLDQTDTGAGDRSARLEHRARVGDGVARTHRLQPAYVFDAGRAQARGAAEIVLHHQPHADGAGVPAARDQAAEQRVPCFRRVNMEGLRIELAAEVDDLA